MSNASVLFNVPRSTGLWLDGSCQSLRRGYVEKVPVDSFGVPCSMEPWEKIRPCRMPGSRAVPMLIAVVRMMEVRKILQ